MNHRISKREFLRKLGGGALATAAGPGLLGMQSAAHSAETQSAPATKRAEPSHTKKNWLWMRPGTGRSDDDWRRDFARIKAAGIDAVVPEVYSGGQALFSHPSPLINTRAKTLEQMIPLAHQTGLEVHAWMWTMPCNNAKVIKAHPDWYAVNGIGESAHDKPAYVDYYRFLCPRKAPVQRFIESNVAALGQIDGLDGVHLDYVRLPDVILAKGLWKKYDIVQDREYPQYDYCYCDDCRRQFRQQTGIDPHNDLKDPSASDAWRQFRCDGVTDLVNGRLAPKAREYGKQITAAVFPNWWNVRQEWHRWNLDGFLPMLYHTFYKEDIAWIGEQTKAAIERLKQAKPVYAGLFVSSLAPEDLATAVFAAHEAGAAGISLFAFDSLGGGHWQMLPRALARNST